MIYFQHLSLLQDEVISAKSSNTSCVTAKKVAYTLPKIFQRCLSGIFSIIQLKEE